MMSRGQIMSLNKFILEQTCRLDTIRENIGSLVISVNEAERELKKLEIYLKSLELDGENRDKIQLNG